MIYLAILFLVFTQVKQTVNPLINHDSRCSAATQKTSLYLPRALI